MKDIWQKNKKLFHSYLITCLFLLVIVILFSGNVCAEGDDALFIDEKGNVGIGTDKPEAALDVNGDLNVSGTAKAGKFEGDGAIPKGVIVMWSGKVDEIPEGWALCDGENGTPNLVDRFIVGAGESDDAPQPNSSGEADQTAKTEPAGKHSHLLPARWYARNFRSGLGKANSGIDTGGTYNPNEPTRADGEHSHKVTFVGKNRPRWYALCFIMKL